MVSVRAQKGPGAVTPTAAFWGKYLLGDDDAYSDVCGGADDRDDSTNDYNDVDDCGDRKDGVMIMLMTVVMVMVVIPQSRTAELYRVFHDFRA